MCVTMATRASWLRRARLRTRECASTRPASVGKTVVTFIGRLQRGLDVCAAYIKTPVLPNGNGGRNRWCRNCRAMDPPPPPLLQRTRANHRLGGCCSINSCRLLSGSRAGMDPLCAPGVPSGPMALHQGLRGATMLNTSIQKRSNVLQPASWLKEKT